MLQAAPGATCTGSSPSAGCTSFDYDAANQVTARHYLDGATTDVTSISYDADGRPTGQSDASGTSSASYDSLGRLASYTDGHGTTTSYGYDLAGNQTSISYPGSGHTVTNSYDADNRLARVSDWYSHTISFGYDPDSNLTSTTWPSATSEVDQAGYNDADEPTLIQDLQSSTVLASYSYGYNGNNQLVATTTTGISDPTQAYAYNSVQELTQSGPTGSPTSYGYDHANDLVTRTSNTTGTEAPEV